MAKSREKVMRQDKARQRLTRLLAPTRQGTGIPPSMVSDSVAYAFIEQVDVLLPLFVPLGLGDGVTMLKSDLRVDQIPGEAWQAQSRIWGEINQVRDTFLALDRLLRSVRELHEKGQLQIELGLIRSVVPVLVVLNFVPAGKRISAGLVHALGCNEQASADIIDCYRMMLECGNEDKLKQVHRIIVDDSMFYGWVKDFISAAMKIKLPDVPLPLRYIEIAGSVLFEILERGGRQ
jgi:hypothetical protein